MKSDFLRWLTFLLIPYIHFFFVLAFAYFFPPRFFYSIFLFGFCAPWIVFFMYYFVSDYIKWGNYDDDNGP